MDLPEPLGPIRPMRARSSMVKAMLRKSGSAPNDLEIPWALRIGASEDFSAHRLRRGARCGHVFLVRPLEILDRALMKCQIRVATSSIRS